MSNELYYSFIGDFASGQEAATAYRSPSAGGFNPNIIGDGGPMWAAAVIYPTGRWLDNDAFDNFIFGNLDTALFTGWGLRIIDNRNTSGTVDLAASFGDSAQVNDVLVPLSTFTPPADNRIEGAGLIERLLLVAMTLEAIEGGVHCALFVNGQRVAEDDFVDVSYAASALPLSLGTEPDATGTAPCGGILINSAAYRGPGANAPASNANAGAMFRIAREAHQLGFLRNDATSQQAFDHLYLASQASGTVGGKLNAPATFAFNVPYLAADELPDAGQGAVTPPPSQQSLAAIELEAATPGGLTVSQIANCDWYPGYQPLGLIFSPPG